MEKILKEINARIKEIAQSEEINTQELTELINIRDRLKGYNTTSIAQVQGFNTGNNLTFPAPVARFGGGLHQVNSTFDGIMDIANIFFKNQAEQLKNRDDTNIHELISYHMFISKLEPSPDEITNTERFETKNEIENLIMKEFKNIITKEKNKEKNIEENKILETTAEVKTTLTMET